MSEKLYYFYIKMQRWPHSRKFRLGLVFVFIAQITIASITKENQLIQQQLELKKAING